MPLYYFHTLGDLPDAENSLVEMDNFGEAKAAAASYLMDLLREKLEEFGSCQKMNCLIKSENGQDLLRLTLNMEISERRRHTIPLIAKIKSYLGLRISKIAWENGL
jgi:hypothetical protein